MRIVLDARHRMNLSGAVSYLRALVPELVALPTQHEFLLLEHRGQSQHGGLDCERIELPSRSSAAQAVADQVTLPHLLRRVGADLYHPLKYLGSLRAPCLQVTTLHAITESYHGSLPMKASEAVYWTHMGRRIVRSSDHVIAVSEFLREFLLERLGVPLNRITVIPNGFDPRFRALPTHQASPSFLLAVGNVVPVKNFQVLLHVLSELEAEFPEIRLCIAGSTQHAHARELAELAVSLGIDRRVDFLGHLGIDDLVRRMNDATLLLMPSLTEGCPVTLLEAMACGAPVIAARRGGIPEVGGSAIRMVTDPLDVDGWVAETRALLASEAERKLLADAGIQRSRTFSWRATAERTVEVYDRLAATARGRGA